MLKRFLFALAFCMGATIVTAQITIPNSFTSGTSISSSQMNANFVALADAVNRAGGTMTGTLTARNIAAVANDTYDIGTGAARFQDAFFSGTITGKELTLESPAVGITVGGNNIINTVGKIPAISSSYFASLSGANLTTLTAANISAGALDSAMTLGGTTIKVVGKETLWVPASSMSPTITNGATGPVTSELTAGQPNVTALSFANGSNKNAQFAVAFPKSWNASTITYQALWTGTAAGAGTTIWGLQCVASADNATIDAAFGTAIEVTDTFLTVKYSHVAAESGAVTISGAAADTITTCQIYRKGASDTRAAASLLLGVKLFYTTNAKNDT